MIKKFLAIILSVTILFCTVNFIGCGKTEENQEEPAVLVNEVLYDGFEKWDSDMSRILLINDFGKVSFNTDEQFVKFGEGSAKLEPRGGTHSTLKPVMLLPMQSEMYEYDYTDYTKVKALSFWLYNAQDEIKTVGIALASEKIVAGQWYDKLDRTNAVSYTLNSGWNYIEYDLQPQYLSTHPTFKQDCVRYLCLEFDYVNPLKYAAPVYYLDDVRLHYSENAVTGKEISLKFDGENGVWEISDFEEKEQVLLSSVKAANNKNRLSASIVNASKYNQTAKSGSNVLELLRRPGSSSENQGWPQLTFSEVPFVKVFEAIGDDIVANPQNYAIKIDYYNASPVEQKINISFTTSGTTGDINPWVSITAKPFEWGEYELSVKDIQDACTEMIEKAFANIEEEVKKADPIYLEKDVMYLKNPGKMIFTVDGFGLDDDLRERVMLFDNIRIERVSAQ